jgi:hypothetical protein
MDCERLLNLKRPSCCLKERSGTRRGMCLKIVTRSLTVYSCTDPFSSLLRTFFSGSPLSECLKGIAPLPRLAWEPQSQPSKFRRRKLARHAGRPLPTPSEDSAPSPLFPTAAPQPVGAGHNLALSANLGVDFSTALPFPSTTLFCSFTTWNA